ncbi:MAG TPA: lipoyl synthase, partial [Syntrophales bacterium]|nr:lipoyl synthase [Syntrophales bacterium]
MTRSHMRKPPWLKVRLPREETYRDVRRLLRTAGLSTVCEEALCPNRAECFQSGTATFLLLGDVCSRNCRYCNVKHGDPPPPEETEPERVAEAARKLGLRYVVVTSVTR